MLPFLLIECVIFFMCKAYYHLIHHIWKWSYFIYSCSDFMHLYFRIGLIIQLSLKWNK